MKRKYDPFDPNLLIKVAEFVIANGGEIRFLKPSFGKFFGEYYPIVAVIAWRDTVEHDFTDTHKFAEMAASKNEDIYWLKVCDKDGKPIKIKWFSKLERLLNVLQTQLKNGQACKLCEQTM